MPFVIVMLLDLIYQHERQTCETMAIKLFTSICSEIPYFSGKYAGNFLGIDRIKLYRSMGIPFSAGYYSWQCHECIGIFLCSLHSVTIYYSFLVYFIVLIQMLFQIALVQNLQLSISFPPSGLIRNIPPNCAPTLMKV
jgi:hypothetical protein